MPRRFLSSVVACLLLALGAGCAHDAASGGRKIEPARLEQARAELRRALHEETAFVKVHAAEALLEFGIGQDVNAVFEAEQPLHDTESPYRIGIWRVLARTAASPAERQVYIDKILAVYHDPSAIDSDGAVETLAKLEYHVPAADRDALAKWSDALPTSRRSFGRWLLAVSGDDDDVRRLAAMLREDDPPTRGAAAYGMRFIAKKVPPDVIPLLEAAADEIRPQDQRGHIVGNAFVFTTDPAKASIYRKRLIAIARTGTKLEKFEALNCFAEHGDGGDVPMLIDLMRDPEADVRLNASRALLKIDGRLQ